MIAYSTFRPTAFDPEGLGLPDRQDWLVVPVLQTRDSGPLSMSNFRVALQQLGGESGTVEVHRFNHWGPGWFEIILAHPSREADVTDIEASLEQYPVLDDEDHGQEMYERATEYWQSMSIRERMKWCTRYTTSIFAARRDTIPERVDITELAE